jgi:hypothetical protein
MKKTKYTGLVLGLLMLVASSCDSFIDINKDPNNPTSPQLSLLLPATAISTELTAALPTSSNTEPQAA